MKTTCKCEHWQICPMCKPEWHNPDGTRKPVPRNYRTLESAEREIYRLQAQIAKDTARIAVLGDALRELAEEFDWHDPQVAKAQELLGETA